MGESVRIKISGSRALFVIAITLLLSGILPIIGSVIMQRFLPGQRWVQESFHSSIEAVGALVALMLGVLLLLMMKHRKDLAHYVWVSSALIGMGILDGIHASIPGGVPFVWLRGTSTLIGGLLFALVWLPKTLCQSRLAKLSPKVVAVVVGVFGILSILFPNEIPEMLRQGVFTTTAEIMHIFAGLLFLIATLNFLSRYLNNQQLDDLLFASLCLLFSLASPLFQFSRLWEADWWFSPSHMCL